MKNIDIKDLPRYSNKKSNNKSNNKSINTWKTWEIWVLISEIFAEIVVGLLSAIFD